MFSRKAAANLINRTSVISCLRYQMPIAAQNAVTAAQSFGMGFCCIEGSKVSAGLFAQISANKMPPVRDETPSVTGGAFFCFRTIKNKSSRFYKREDLNGGDGEI